MKKNSNGHHFESEMKFYVLAVLFGILAVFSVSCQSLASPDQITRKYSLRDDFPAIPITPSPEQRHWEKMPSPPPNYSSTAGAVRIDSNNDLWCIFGDKLFYWDRSIGKWRGPVLPAGQYLTSFLGGAATGLYFTQPGKEKHWGEIYRLEKGKATYITTFYYEHSCNFPLLDVSKDGRIFNRTNSRLRIYHNKKWIEYPKDGAGGAIISDKGGRVCFYDKGMIYHIDKKNKLNVVKVDPRVDKGKTHGALWGKDNALLYKYATKGVCAFNLSTGRFIDTSAINNTIGNLKIYRSFSLPDGNVWLIAYNWKSTSYVLFCIAEDGDVSVVNETKGIPWTEKIFFREDRSALMDGNYDIWIAIMKKGVFKLTKNGLTEYDPRVNCNPPAPKYLAVDNDGVVYAATKNGLYVYRHGPSIAGRERPDPVPVYRLGTPTWTYRCKDLREFEKMWQTWDAKIWYLDDLVLFRTEIWRPIVALNLKNGEPRFSIIVSDKADRDAVWFLKGRTSRELIIRLSQKFHLLEASSGKIRRTVNSRNIDRHTMILPLGNDYILADCAMHGAVISRLSSSGEERWYLSQYPDKRTDRVLICHEPYLIYQSYNETIRIDLSLGYVLWHDYHGADGLGLSFDSNGLYLVESLRFDSGSEVIARNPETGKRIWQYKKTGAKIIEKPLIDSSTSRVFALFEDSVICLDGISGELIWEQRLYQPPIRLPGDDQGGLSAMALNKDILAVTDASEVINLYNVETGNIVKRIALTEDIIKQGKTVGREKLVAKPCFFDDLIVLATENKISAYQLFIKSP